MTKYFRQSFRGDLSLPVPWSNVYGLARSILVLSPLLTLLCTPSNYLFFPINGSAAAVHCSGLSGAGFFCLAGQGYLEVERWVAVAVLAVVASGWRPRWTCLPHWYLTISFFYNSAAPEGGDQISAIVALLLIPVCLTDSRKWHWLPDRGDIESNGLERRFGATVAVIAIALVKIQVSWVYLQSGISKLSHGFWLDGTAMYYWTRNDTFGAPSWSRGFAYSVTEQPVLEAISTWVPILIEVAAGISILLRPRFRLAILTAGFLLHFCIGLVIGLWSFAIAMWGCLVFLLIPMGVQISPEYLSVTFHRLMRRTERSAVAPES